MAKASAKKTATKQKKSAKDSPSQRFEQIFKNVDDILQKDSGCTGELDYTEQSSWLLFLKYLDALEEDRKLEAELNGAGFVPILEDKYRWSRWAAPRNDDGEIDSDSRRVGPDLLEFVNDELFPYLKSFKQTAKSSSTIEYKIGEIFDEVRNRISSGYTLGDLIEQLDKLNFRSQDQKHELSDLYEVKIRRMGNAGRNGGEYYTPRPLIRAIIEVVDPQIGETIYDPALGSAGFLCEAFEYLKERADTVGKREILQSRTFYGKEKKSLAYVIGIMNMILHGIEAPNVLHTNTLSENVQQIQEKNRYDVVLANPPFGGGEREEVQQNFPIRSAETAYLFMQHFIKSLKANGRAGIVIKSTFLSNADAAALRRELLEQCDLHTVLDLPEKTFQGAGVRAVVLFFTKGKKTDKIWYYQLDPGRKLGKTNPLNDADLADFLVHQPDRASTAQSWMVDVANLDPETWDLTVRNPSSPNATAGATPTQIFDELEQMQKESGAFLGSLQKFTTLIPSQNTDVALSDICQIRNGATPKTGTSLFWGGEVNWMTPAEMGGRETPYVDSTQRTLTQEGLDSCSASLAPPFSVILSCRAPIGYVVINTVPMATNQGCKTLIPNEGVYYKYLYHYLAANTDLLNGLGTGATFPEISARALKKVRIPLPSASEQKRIADSLDGLTEACRSLEGAVAGQMNAVRRFRAAALQALLRNSL